MLQLVLFLLKIIGILLGVILGLLLILILVVLLVPIKYRIWADNREDLQGRIKVTWLLRIISLQVAYVNEKLSIKLKIFGRIFFDNNNSRKVKKARSTKVKSNSKNKKRKSRKAKNNTTIDVPQSMMEEDSKGNHLSKELNVEGQNAKDRNYVNQSIQQNKPDSIVSHTDAREQKTRIDALSSDSNQIKPQSLNVDLIEIRDESSEYDEKKSEKDTKFINKIKGFFKKIKRFFGKISEFFQKVKLGFEKFKNLFHTLGESISNILNKWDKIKSFYRLNKLGIKQSFYAIKKVIKHIMPRKIKGQLEFGTGDPCSTGQALGVAACFYGLYGKSVQIIPNFNEQIIEGNLYIYGRIRLVTLLIIAIKLILNKNFKELIKNFRALKEDL